MLDQALKKIGLSDKEAKVYLASLQVGSQPVSVIAKKAGLNRSTTYLILDELKKKGLAGQFSKAKVSYFDVVDPNDLPVYIDRLQNDLERQKLNIKDLVPSFLNLVNPYKSKPKVSFFEGIEGIKEVYEDTLKEGVKEIFSFWGVDVMPQVIADYILNDYIPRRGKKNIFCYVIAPDLPKAYLIKKRDKKELRKTVLINNKKYPFDVEINIYQNKVAFMSYKPGEEVGVILTSEYIFNTLKNIHRICAASFK